MFLEDWKRIDRLLILSLIEEQEAIDASRLIQNLIDLNLPQLNVQTLLIAKDEHYFHPIIQSKIKYCLVEEFTNQCFSKLVNWLQSFSFDAAIVLTTPTQSAFSLAYLCYLANIPIRIGYSQEFGGGVLSDCIKPPPEILTITNYNLHLLKSVGFPGLDIVDMAID